MNKFVDVKLWGNPVGTLYWNEQQQIASFEYDSKYFNNGFDLAPLMMPLSSSNGQVFEFAENRNKCFQGLPGLVSDSLPDAFGNSIIDEWVASRGIALNEFTPLDRLCYVGKRAMGALEFMPAQHLDGLNTSTLIHIQELTDLARDILNEREKFQANLKTANKNMADILKVGTSAGGAKPKAIIAYNPNTGQVRSGQVKAPEGFGYYLLKFDGVEDSKINDNPKGIGKIEYAYYKMALDCNISMSECSLLRDGEFSHFMTKRFDRLETGEKLHVQTLAAMAHYNRDTRYSYEQAFQVMRKLELPYSDYEQFFRRMVFNVMARNHDDHTKNHSFIMDKGGTWRLAPAYDLSYSYSKDGKWTNQHQMSLNNKRDDFEYSDLVKVAQNMGIRKYNEIISQIAEIVSKWTIYATAAGVEKRHSNQIGRYHLILQQSKSHGWEESLGM